MKEEIKIPAMGESISQAIIGAILKPSGSTVKADEEIVELETEKVNQVLYAPKAGVLTLNVKSDDIVKIGQVIGFIEEQKAASNESPKAAATSTQKLNNSKEKQENEKERQAVASKDKQEIKPKDKKEMQVAEAEQKKEKAEEVASIRMSKESYLQKLSEGEKEKAPAPEKQPIQSSDHKMTDRKNDAIENKETRRRMTTIRKVIAQRLVEAQNSMAMLTTFNEVDLTEIVALREKYKETFLKKYGVRLGFMSFFVKAVVHALKVIGDLNSYIDGDQIVHREYYDIGVAVGTDRGLVVPVLKACDALTFPEIEKAIEVFALKAREGSLAIEDLQGGGFTITNGGVYGSLLSTPIVNPPQSGILGMHKIQKRPVVINDSIVIRSMMYLALSYDHRIVDGKEAVAFLVEIKNTLESPARLLLDI